MTSTAMHLFHMKRVRTPIPFPEGVNEVNRLSREDEKYYRLPTWTDIIAICFQKEEYFVFFGSNQIKFWLIGWSNGKNFRFVDTSTCKLLQPISKSQKSYIENTTHLYISLKRQRWKTEHFFFRWTSLLKYTTKRGYWMSLQSIKKFLRRQSSHS